jgi:NADP-dependent aldehyde dehydrogenase
LSHEAIQAEKRTRGFPFACAWVAGTMGTMSVTLTGKSIIGYARGTGVVPAGRGRNPALGEELEPEYVSATESEVERAGDLAAAAFPAFSSLSPRRRAGFLRAVATQIEGLGAELVERMTAETGLPAARVEGERGRTCGQLRMFAELIEDGSWAEVRIETARPDRAPLPKPDLRSMLVPSGPVAVFCAGNFPLAFSVAGGDTASALAAGCPVVVNAHSGHPGTAEMVGLAVVEAARETGMPEGVFSLLYGAGHAVGQALVRHPAIRGVGFTGSRAGGTALMALAASRPVPIPVFAEMSSVNPVFVLDHALRERWGAIAAGLHGSVTGGVGQFCTKPGLVFLNAGREADQFVAKLGSLVAATAACPMLNQAIADNFATRRSRLGSMAAVQVVAEGVDHQAGVFLTTARSWRKNGVLHEEVFGPSTLVVLCENDADLVRSAEALEGQLTATVHAEAADSDVARALLPVLARKAGRVVHNGFPTGVEVCHAMVHGGPFPATSDGRTTSVGSAAITRWTRAVCFQNTPASLLPAELQDGNPRKLWRLVDGAFTRAPQA